MLRIVSDSGLKNLKCLEHEMFETFLSKRILAHNIRIDGFIALIGANFGRILLIIDIGKDWMSIMTTL